MELLDIGVLGVLCCISSAIFSHLVVKMLMFQREYRLSDVENKVEGLQKARYQEIGKEVKQEKKERMSEAMAKAAVLMKDGQPDKQKLMVLAAEYPDVALDVAKKIGLNKLF